LLGSTVQPDDRGLFAAGTDGKLLNDDFHEHDLSLVTSDKDAESAKPVLTIRAKYTPFAALRQQFWRIYSSQYDVNESGSFSQIEIFSLLDSLGSTLAPETVQSFFSRYDKDWDDDELTTDELVLCLEEELRKHKGNKPAGDSPESGVNTPGLAEGLKTAFNANAGDFVNKNVVEDPAEYDQTDMSSDMQTIAP
jgi:phosphatidylserine decarboxylase